MQLFGGVSFLQPDIVLEQNMDQTDFQLIGSKEASGTLMLANAKRVVLATGLNELARRDACLSSLHKPPGVVFFRILVDICAPHFTRVDHDVCAFWEDGTVRECRVSDY